MASPRKKKASTSPAKPRKRKGAVEPASRGLTASEVAATSPSDALDAAVRQIEAAGGACLARYRDPFGGTSVVLAALPIDKVAPTPYQRDLSDSHMKKLATVIEKIGRFLDPIVAVPAADGTFHTPNGHHRLAAMSNLGARSVTALVVPEKEVAFQILALNTEKAHNLKERSLEVIRMVRDLAQIDDRSEASYAFELEDPVFITLGLCYEERPRFGGGAYASPLRRADAFLETPLAESLEERKRRAGKVLKLDDVVTERIAELKSRGFENPYLRAFVLARVNPLRFRRGATMEFDELLDTMIRSAEKMDAGKIKVEDVSRAGGAPTDE